MNRKENWLYLSDSFVSGASLLQPWVRTHMIGSICNRSHTVLIYTCFSSCKNEYEQNRIVQRDDRISVSAEEACEDRPKNNET